MMPVWKRCRTVGVAAAALVAAFGPLAALAAPADAFGTWLTQDGRARIRLEKCGAEQLCGFVVWMREGGEPGALRVDNRNPDPSRRARALLGHQLLAGLALNGDGRFEGQIYNNEDGKKYDVTLWTEGPSQLRLRGCLVAFLCSTQNWTRAPDLAPGQLVGATGAPGGPQPDPEWAKAVGPAPAPRRDAPKPRS